MSQRSSPDLPNFINLLWDRLKQPFLKVPSPFLLIQGQLYPNSLSSPLETGCGHTFLECTVTLGRCQSTCLIGAKLNTPPPEPPFAQTLIAFQLCRTDGLCAHHVALAPTAKATGSSRRHGFLREGKGYSMFLLTCKGGEQGWSGVVRTLVSYVASWGEGLRKEIV